MASSKQSNRPVGEIQIFPQNQQDAGDSVNLPIPFNLADGRDEMNLADQPLGVLDEETARTQKTRTLAIGSYGTLQIKAGSDGLLTVDDEEVLLGLMALTKIRTGFHDRTLEFTRGELLEILQRPDKGQSYNKIKTSIYRLMGVLLDYQNSWWDKRVGSRTNALFHIIESAHITGQEDQENWSQAKCKIRWNEIFLASCEAGYLCKLDLHTQFGLRSPVAKTLRRFLNKKFYNQEELVFDLLKIGVIVGLSEKYKYATKIKEKLRIGLEELKTINFFKSYSYSNPARGVWRIHFQRGSAWRATDTQPETTDLVWPTSPDSSELNPQVIETTATILSPTPTKSKSVKTTPEKTSKSKATSKSAPRRIPKRAPKPSTKLSGQTAGQPVRVAVAPSPPPLPAMVSELMARGVSETEARRFTVERDESYLRQKLDEHDYRLENGQAPANPGAHLAASIRNNYAAPLGYMTRAERERLAHEQAAVKARVEADAARLRDERQLVAQIDFLLQELDKSPQKRAEQSQQAIEALKLEITSGDYTEEEIAGMEAILQFSKAGALRSHLQKKIQAQGFEATARELGLNSGAVNDPPKKTAESSPRRATRPTAKVAGAERVGGLFGKMCD